jgi:hypothetical protein
MAAPKRKTPKVEEIFTQSQWKEQAEKPDTLEQIGRKWDETISTKGQALKAYLEDLKLAYKMLRDPNFQLERGKKSR